MFHSISIKYGFDAIEHYKYSRTPKTLVLSMMTFFSWEKFQSLKIAPCLSFFLRKINKCCGRTTSYFVVCVYTFINQSPSAGFRKKELFCCRFSLFRVYSLTFSVVLLSYSHVNALNILKHNWSKLLYTLWT